MPAVVETLTGKGDWQTPPWLFEKLNSWFCFSYDAFASHENHLCSLYSTESGTYWSFMSEPELDSPLDGLSYPWANERVFLNPPYSRDMMPLAMAKCMEERDKAEIIVALIPFDPSTRWWNNYVEGNIVIPLKKRVRFVGAPGVATFPSCIVVFKKSLLDG